MSQPKFWMNTVSDRVLQFPVPDVRAIDPEDVAHSLAMTCRFGGHVLWHYSVAEHSLHVSRLVEEMMLEHNGYCLQSAHSLSLGDAHEEEKIRQYSLAGLLHDASEYMVADLISPLKQYLRSIGADHYASLESQIMVRVMQRFSLPDFLWKDPIIKRADNVMYATESAQLRRVTVTTPPSGNPELVPLAGYDLGLERGAAEAAWLRRFAELR